MIALLIALVLALYLRGLTRLRHRPLASRVATLLAGLAILFAALVWPLHHVPTFSLHMVQHLAIGWLAAALLAFSAPWPVFAAALPGRVLCRAARWLAPLGRPLAATIVHGVVVWLWHLPVPYEWAMHDPLAHTLEHACFLVGGLALWWMVFRALRHGGAAAAVACGCLLVTTVHEGMLGGLLTLGQRPLYPSHPDLADQHLAGLIMWVPVGMLYLVAGALLGRRVTAPAVGRRHYS